MTGPKGRRPEPPDSIALPALTPFSGPTLEAGGDYEATALVDLDLSGQMADGIELLGCRVERCRLDGLSMRRARISECLLLETQGASIDMADSTWRDVLFADGRIGALTVSSATWTSVRVRGARLDFVDLTTARLTDVAFEGCVIGVLDVGDAQLRSVRFDGCTIGELDVTGARLVGVDLSRAELGTVRGIGSLRGAIVGPGQLVDLAPLLAAHVGLEIRGD